MTDLIQTDFFRGATSFLFAGYPAWIAAELCRIVRREEISEPVECMNYLDFNLSRTPHSWHDRMMEGLYVQHRLVVDIGG